MKTRLGLLYSRTKRRNFSGIFSRFGNRTLWLRGKPIPNGAVTVLLKDVRFKDELVTDHLWIREPELFLSMTELKQGDRVLFQGLVDCFAKGSDEVDFHVVQIKNVRRKKQRKEERAA